MNMNLRELYLADNKLNGLQDSAQLGNLLKFNCNIQILDLRNNHILDSGRDTARCYLLTSLFTPAFSHQPLHSVSLPVLSLSRCLNLSFSLFLSPLFLSLSSSLFSLFSLSLSHLLYHIMTTS